MRPNKPFPRYGRRLQPLGVWAVAVSTTACARATRAPGLLDAALVPDTSLGAEPGPVSGPGPRADAPDPPQARVQEASVTRAECDGDAAQPYGCDYQTQACVAGNCQTCGPGTEPFLTVCEKKCKTDRDCPEGLVCIFNAGALFTCEKPAAKKKCPRGQIWLRSDGECWKTCKSDHDCPEDMCCLADPNAPMPICMGRCL
jgi:hypothetical protein